MLRDTYGGVGEAVTKGDSWVGGENLGAAEKNDVSCSRRSMHLGIAIVGMGSIDDEYEHVAIAHKGCEVWDCHLGDRPA